MGLVGQSEAEAIHLVGQQATHTDQLRAHVRTLGSTVESLAHATYVSATTQALAAKFETETRPQFEKAIAHSEASQEGTKQAVAMFSATQNDGAASINSI
jgi:hypothetical protein